MKIDFAAVESLIAETAETYLLPRFQNLAPGEVDHKIGDDPVTIADRESEKALTIGLTKILPGSRVLGEEAFFADPKLISLFESDDPVWIVDPLDGTRQFIAGETSFGVIVSLTVRQETVAGWLYSPIAQAFTFAEKGSGAFYQGTQVHVLPPAPVPQMRGLLGKMIIQAYPFANNREADPTAPQFVGLGTACYGYQQLVTGPAQQHFRANYQFTTPWDDAAGVLIHQEAGGYAAHWGGQAYQPSSYREGILLSPDRASWESLRAWIEVFCPIPAK